MMLPIGAAVLSLGVCLPLFMTYRASPHPVLAALFKALATLCALVVALVAAIRLNDVCWICVIALFFHAAADFMLEFSFPVGMGLFVAGHVCYIAFFTRIYPLILSQVICMLAFLGLIAYFLYRWRKEARSYYKIFIPYGVVLSAMCGFAVGGGLAQYTTQGFLVAGGGALFFLSDMLLVKQMLFPAGRLMPWAVMITYESAQLLFAASCLFL